jgi:long-chain acyl-CoA synthetase
MTTSNRRDIPDSLVASLETSIDRFGDRPAFGLRRDNQWVWVTYAQFGRLVDWLRGGLAQLGIEAGDRVAVISGNRLEWAGIAYAAYGRGAVIVPMYETQPAAEWEHILRDSGAKVLFAADRRIADRVEDARRGLPELRHVVVIDGNGQDSLADLTMNGRMNPVSSVWPWPDDIAGLIYTSGTTGLPKGVMLTHGNIISDFVASARLFPIDENDRSLAFLPWAHSFGQTAELHCLLWRGASIAVCGGLNRLLDDIGEVRPTVFFTVPEVFNRARAAVLDKVQKKPRPLAALLMRGIHAAMAATNNARLNWLDRLARGISGQLVFKSLRKRFGGRLRFCFCGGAALGRETAIFLEAADIPVYEGYGLTETSPMIAVNCPGAYRRGSVGRPLPGVKVEIDHAPDETEGEIVVRGPNVMKGYWDRSGEHDLVGMDGRFRTGDLGRLDDDGYLFITGRIKEKYKLSNGKYVAPVAIEEQLKLSPYIAQVMVCGDDRPHNVAVIVPKSDALQNWAVSVGLNRLTTADLLRHEATAKLFRQEIDRMNARLKSFEKVKGFVLAAEEFSQTNDQLTPTMKLKRRNILKRWQESIERLYA